MKLQFHFILLLILCVITSKRNWVFTTSPINPENEKMSSCMSNNNSYPKKKIIFTCLLRNFLYSLVVIRFLLFLSGDVELNPGPTLSYTQFTTSMKKYNDQVKFLHQNCQSVLGQRLLLLKNFLSDLGDNCISGFSETCLKSVNDIPFWLIHSEYLVSFRCDRRTDLPEKNKGGGILFVPKKFHPKARNDLETMSKDHFESVWVESKINKKPALINLAYCPEKQLINAFLEELALDLDRAATENKKKILIGDYNFNYYNCNERNLIETLILPYGSLKSNKL